VCSCGTYSDMSLAWRGGVMLLDRVDRLSKKWRNIIFMRDRVKQMRRWANFFKKKTCLTFPNF
jgi:hypothetical protein